MLKHHLKWIYNFYWTYSGIFGRQCRKIAYCIQHLFQRHCQEEEIVILLPQVILKKNIFLSSFCWQLLYQDDEPQIRYSYLLPKDYPNIQYQREQQQPAEPVPLGHRGVQAQPTQPTPNRQTYAWRLIGFTQCTHSCAGGTWFNSSLFFVVGGSATDFVTSFSF